MDHPVRRAARRRRRQGRDRRPMPGRVRLSRLQVPPVHPGVRPARPADDAGLRAAAAWRRAGVFHTGYEEFYGRSLPADDGGDRPAVSAPAGRLRPLALSPFRRRLADRRAPRQRVAGDDQRLRAWDRRYVLKEYDREARCSSRASDRTASGSCSAPTTRPAPARSRRSTAPWTGPASRGVGARASDRRHRGALRQELLARLRFAQREEGLELGGSEADGGLAPADERTEAHRQPDGELVERARRRPGRGSRRPPSAARRRSRRARRRRAPRGATRITVKLAIVPSPDSGTGSHVRAASRPRRTPSGESPARRSGRSASPSAVPRAASLEELALRGDRRLSHGRTGSRARSRCCRRGCG